MPNDALPANPFQFDDQQASFESLGKENGFRHWSARSLQQLLGYANWESFRKVINRVTNACTTLDIPVIENVVQSTTMIGGVEEKDFKLSKFACYLAAMNADAKISEVAQAQAYFAAIAAAFQKYIGSCEDVARVEVRAKLKDGERALSSVAKAHGVSEYAFFQDAGYRGMYNMSLRSLKKHKGLKGTRPLLDFMGDRELAANLFRITETTAKIEHEDIQGQKPLEIAAFDVGRDVRKMMQKQGGSHPEDLPLSMDIKKIGTDLKKTHKHLGKPKAP